MLYQGEVWPSSFVLEMGDALMNSLAFSVNESIVYDLNSCSGNLGPKLHYGNVVNMSSLYSLFGHNINQSRLFPG